MNFKLKHLRHIQYLSRMDHAKESAEDLLRMQKALKQHLDGMVSQITPSPKVQRWFDGLGPNAKTYTHVTWEHGNWV